MSDLLTVPTDFTDIADLAQGLADRVDEERLMLYGPQPFTDGEWIRFAVLLADESPALEGVGRTVASIDGGEERPEMFRYDIVLDSLKLEGRAEVVYERILMARQTGQPITAEIDASEVEEVEPTGGVTQVREMDLDQQAADDGGFAEPPEETPVDSEQHDAFEAAQDETYAEAQPAGYAEPPAELGDEAGYAADESDYEAAGAEDEPAAEAEPPRDWEVTKVGVMLPDDGERAPLPPMWTTPAMPASPPGFQVQRISTDGQPLRRPSRGRGWVPEALDAPEPRASSGLFQYGGGLPLPARPPRPDMDPSYRVTPAPRPTAAEQDTIATVEADVSSLATGGNADTRQVDVSELPEGAYFDSDAEVQELEPLDESLDDQGDLTVPEDLPDEP